MFISKYSKAGDYIFIKNFSPRNYGAPARKRVKRDKGTPKAMEKYNQFKRSEKLQMLMILNFDKGFHVILDYPKGAKPQTYEEAEKNLMKCLHKVSRRLKKKGKRFKYIAVTERGKKAAALHHHVIIEGFSEYVEELISVWGPHIKFFQMYEEGAYKDLADYILKAETKEEQAKGASRYHRSRNLKEPIVRASFISGAIKDDPDIPKGYHLVQGTLVNGYNEVLGIRHQSYVVKKMCTPDEKKVQKKGTKSTGVQKGIGIFKKIRDFFKRRRD